MNFRERWFSDWRRRSKASQGGIDGLQKRPLEIQYRLFGKKALKVQIQKFLEAIDAFTPTLNRTPDHPLRN